MFRRTLFIVMAAGMLTCLSQSCSYRLDAASIPPAMKTVDVQFFENSAPYVVNNLSQLFTESLKDRIRSQTRLSVTRGEGDATFSGNIVGYAIAPISVQANNTATAPPIATGSRLTITVNVKYTLTDKFDKKLNFEQSFSRYADFNGDIGNQEQALIANINRQLTEDIFNKAFANWN